jgi:hypothetical protein
MFAKVLGTTLAGTVFATAAIGGSAGFADTTPATATAPAVAAADHTNRHAIDALHDVLDRMARDGVMTLRQRDAVVDAVRKADWDGYSVERLGDILGVLVKGDVISARQRDAITGGVARSDKVLFRFAVVLDRLTDNGTISRDQNDAIRDALRKADWDGFSIDRLGRILADLVRHGAISAVQRDAIMDGMRR